jgi:hypothetical protein
MPILNLSVTERTSILGIQLLPKEGTSEDEEAIARFFSENGKTASQAGNNERPVWYETETRAELTLEATYFDEAAAEARRRVSRAVDWLSYILRLSVLGMRTDERLILVPWIRARSFAAVSVGQEAYVRDLSEPSLKACLYDFQPLKGDPSVALSASDLKAYSDVKELFQSISGKPIDLSHRFWSALRWLRRARESIDERDKLLDLWIALEFLVSEEVVPKLCSSTEVDALSEVLENEAMKLGVDGDLAARRFKEFVKLGLLLYVADKLGINLSFEKDVIAKVWSMQNQTSGGIFTNITPDGGWGESDTNTETTAFVIMGMTSIQSRIPEFPSSALVILILGVVLTVSVVPIQSLRHAGAKRLKAA